MVTDVMSQISWSNHLSKFTRSRVEYLLELQGTGAIMYICLIESLDTRENLGHPVPPSIHHETYGHTSKGSTLYHRSDLASIIRLARWSYYCRVITWVDQWSI